jgi:PAS domain S-box-containing protein
MLEADEYLFYSIVHDFSDRKRAERLLRESEERFRKLFECHSAVKVIFDCVEPYRVIDANAAAAQFYGYSIEQMRTMRISDFTLTPQVQLNALEELLQKPHLRVERLHRLADGSIRNVEIFPKMMQIGGRPLLFAIVHDITDRKRAERLLCESEERFRKLFECHSAMSVICDAEHCRLWT